MKLHEQRDTLHKACVDSATDLRDMLGFLARKCMAPYPDGSCNNQVNWETDVEPYVRQILDKLETPVQEIRHEHAN